MKVPHAGDHGKIVAEVLKGADVYVVSVTDSAVMFSFDKKLRLPGWPVGLAAFESGEFIQMDGDQG